MLGAFPSPAFTTCQVDLDLGDVIIMFSDGLLDTKIGGVAVDEQHPADLLSGSADVSAQALVDTLVLGLQQCDRPLRDDIAIMALGRTPLEE